MLHFSHYSKIKLINLLEGNYMNFAIKPEESKLIKFLSLANDNTIDFPLSKKDLLEVKKACYNFSENNKVREAFEYTNDPNEFVLAGKKYNRMPKAYDEVFAGKIKYFVKGFMNEPMPVVKDEIKDLTTEMNGAQSLTGFAVELLDFIHKVWSSPEVSKYPYPKLASIKIADNAYFVTLFKNAEKAQDDLIARTDFPLSSNYGVNNLLKNAEKHEVDFYI